MAYLNGKIGVVSQAIGVIESTANKRVPGSAPIATAFLAKEEGFVQPYQVKNNTLYSKPRPTGGFDQPKKCNYVPLNQKPEECVNELNAPIYFPPKLMYTDTSNRFMPYTPMNIGMGFEPHRSEVILEQLIRNN